MQEFRFLEHTADAFFQAFGESFEELVENAAKAMCSVICSLEKVEAKEPVEIEAEGKNKEELIHNFLESLLLEIEMRNMVFGNFKAESLDENRIKVVCKGEKIDASKHELKTEVKAVTWHEFFVKREGNKWVAQVLVDI